MNFDYSIFMHYIYNHEKLPDRLLLTKFSNFLIGYKELATITYSAFINSFGSYNTNDFVKNLYDYVELNGWYDKIVAVGDLVRPEYNITVNSAENCVEICVILDLYEAVDVYHVSIYPETGKVIIPDVDVNKISDIHEVVNIIINMFKDMAKDNLFKIIGNMFIVEESKNLINYTYHIYKTSPRIILAIRDLQKIFIKIMNNDSAYDKFQSSYFKLTVSRSTVTENTLNVFLHFDAYKITLKFKVNGIISLHGAKSDEDVKLVCEFIISVIGDNWNKVIKLLPLAD